MKNADKMLRLLNLVALILIFVYALVPYLHASWRRSTFCRLLSQLPGIKIGSVALGPWG